MARKTISLEREDVDVRFSNWLVQLVSMLKPKNFYGILGRGSGKTSDLWAQRSMQICEDMHGAYFAISSDTYMNARKNVIPSLFEGWRRNGWLDDYHFIADTRPPNHFKRPYKPPLEWKNTITTHHGCHFKIISQDRPSTGAGDSYQHLFADEIKFQAEKKLNKLTPAIRGGEMHLRKSAFYGGRTYTTDMPNTNHGEHDFILDMEKNMDKKQLAIMFQAAEVINEIEVELFHAEESGDVKSIRLANEKLKRWQDRFDAFRNNSTFFFIGSSFVNADALPPNFFKDILESTTNYNDVATSIFSFKPTIERGKKFYPNLSPDNFYRDGYVYDRIDGYQLVEDVEEDSRDLRYCNSDSPLDAGFDSGNMCSLVLGQDQGKVNRLLKFFYTLPEGPFAGFIPELGAQFVKFFEHHRRKELFLYHDRATNKYMSVGDDHASKLKKAIEYHKNGASTGWVVTLMNRNQSNITQQQEYELMLEMLSGNNKKLPKVLIDSNTCAPVKASLENAEKIERVDRHGSKTLHKNKTSERFNWKRLPMESTNPSDAVKYYMCRPSYLKQLSGTSSSWVYIP